MNLEDVITFISTATPKEKAQIFKALTTPKREKLNPEKLKASALRKKSGPRSRFFLKRMVVDAYDLPPGSLGKAAEDVRANLLSDFDGLCSHLEVLDLNYRQALIKVLQYLNQEMDNARIEKSKIPNETYVE